VIVGRLLRVAVMHIVNSCRGGLVVDATNAQQQDRLSRTGLCFLHMLAGRLSMALTECDIAAAMDEPHAQFLMSILSGLRLAHTTISLNPLALRPSYARAGSSVDRQTNLLAAASKRHLAALLHYAASLRDRMVGQLPHWLLSSACSALRPSHQKGANTEDNTQRWTRGRKALRRGYPSKVTFAQSG